jgi:hypothetical protein
MPKSTAVILTYSHPELVPQIVDALRPQGCDIVIADDGLDVRWCSKLDDLRTKRYHHERTMPYRMSTARNGGARLAETDNLIFLDDDCIPLPNLIAEHERALEHDDVSMGLQVITPGDVRSDPRIEAYEFELAPTSWMTHSGNLGVHRDDFLRVGGFDGRTFDGSYGWEDTDLGVRLELAGCTFDLNRWAQVVNTGHHKQYASDRSDSNENKVKFDAKRMGSKRVLVISSGHMVSTYDVWRGWDRALRKAGHYVVSYSYHSRLSFFDVALRAWEDETGHPVATGELIRMAGEGIPATVLDFEPDLIVVSCGLVLPFEVLPLVRKLHVPMAAILTESPYSDENQINQVVQWCNLSFTNDKSSLARLSKAGRTVYLPHSYDPLAHFPRKVGPEYQHDVFFFGTMYPERRALVESVDWTGIDASIAGTRIGKDGGVEVDAATPTGLTTWQPNDELARHYAGSAISLQWHRTTADYFRGTQIGTDAYSLGPRAYEIPACGGMMVSDGSRPELDEVYHKCVPAFGDAQGLQRIVRMLLADRDMRDMLREEQMSRVAGCSFDDRLEQVVWPEVLQCL